MNSLFKIIIAMIIWGSIGLFVKNINLPSLEIVFLRAVTASSILILYGLLEKSTKKFSMNNQEFKSINKKNLCYLIISGIAIALNWLLLFQAYKYTTLSNATLSYYFSPVFVIILSPLVLREKFTKSKFLAVLGALLGLFLILNNQNVNSSVSYNHIKGIMYGLMAAILYASVVLLNKYIKEISGYHMTLIQILTAAVVMLPVVIFRHSLYISNFKTLIFILIVGIIHTGVAYLLYFSSIKDLKAQSVAVVSYIDPISAVIFGAIFLNERMTPLGILGGILILLSTFFGNRENQVNNID